MPRCRRLLLITTALAALLAPLPALADATIPTRDIAIARDHPLLRRYGGSFIVDHALKAFDAVELPTGILKEVPDKRDALNNRVYAPTAALALEGRVTRIVYVAPAGRSPLEVMGNYQQELAARGGVALFACREETCGGDNGRGVEAGGGDQGMLVRVYPRAELRQPAFSNGACAVTTFTSGLRYAAMRLPGTDGDTHVAVLTYTLRDDLYCVALNNRTIAIVTIVEPREREQRMATVEAAEMDAALGRDGRIVLYSILFDVDKAVINPESRPQIAEIARLLKEIPALRLHVVGHTDNQGRLAHNMDLSRRRAQAVVQALVTSHGIAAGRLIGHGVGPIAPVGPNTDDTGRARNRRTELVPQ